MCVQLISLTMTEQLNALFQPLHFRNHTVTCFTDRFSIELYQDYFMTLQGKSFNVGTKFYPYKTTYEMPDEYTIDDIDKTIKADNHYKGAHINFYTNRHDIATTIRSLSFVEVVTPMS